MTEGNGVRNRRRSAEEVQQLLAEFKNNGMPASEFCEKNGLCRSTLYRHLSLARFENKRRRRNKQQAARGQAIVPVEVTAQEQAREEGKGGLALVLANGRRIEVQRDFDEGVLERLVAVLERR